MINIIFSLIIKLKNIIILIKPKIKSRIFQFKYQSEKHNYFDKKSKIKVCIFKLQIKLLFYFLTFEIKRRLVYLYSKV